MHKNKLMILAGLIIFVTALHIMTPFTRLPLHAFFRELYFIPIILAGVWKGVRGGLIASVISSLLYMPHFFLMGDISFHVVNAVEIALFNVAGYMSGLYGDATRRNFAAKKARVYRQAEFGRGMLFLVDDTPLSLQAANWLTKFVADNQDVTITLAWVLSGIDEDFFETPDKSDAYARDARDRAQQYLDRIRETLVAWGMPEGNVREKILKSDKSAQVSDLILEELAGNEYDALVLTKHDVNRTQEFLFGDPAISLVRKSPIPVVVMKGSVDEKDESTS